MCYERVMKLEPSIFDQVDEVTDARRHAEALADIEAGFVIENGDVIEWLETWGKPDEKAAPPSWFK
jgi:predicted transcriptional regulator